MGYFYGGFSNGYFRQRLLVLVKMSFGLISIPALTTVGFPVVSTIHSRTTRCLSVRSLLIKIFNPLFYMMREWFLGSEKLASTCSSYVITTYDVRRDIASVLIRLRLTDIYVKLSLTVVKKTRMWLY